MILRFAPDGSAATVYSEAIELADLGRVRCSRASHVEPTDDGRWTADLSPVGGPVLGPFARRSEALSAEIGWIENWLNQENHRNV